MLIHCDRCEVPGNYTQDLVNLLGVRCLQQLLAEIIRKLVNHEDSKVIDENGQQLLRELSIVLLLDSTLQPSAPIVLSSQQVRVLKQEHPLITIGCQRLVDMAQGCIRLLVLARALSLPLLESGVLRTDRRGNRV